MFGDEIVYLYYSFLDLFKTEPSSFDQLFGHLRYKEARDTIQGIAERMREATRGQ